MSQPQGAQTQPLFSRKRIREIIQEAAPGETADPAAETALVRLAEAFVVELSTAAADLARHRRSAAITPRDVSYALRRDYGAAFMPPPAAAAAVSGGDGEGAGAGPEGAEDAIAAAVRTGRVVRPRTGTGMHRVRTESAMRAATQHPPTGR